MSIWKKLNLVMSGAVILSAVDYLIAGETTNAFCYAAIGLLNLHSGWNGSAITTTEGK